MSPSPWDGYLTAGGGSASAGTLEVQVGNIIHAVSCEVRFAPEVFWLVFAHLKSLLWMCDFFFARTSEPMCWIKRGFGWPVIRLVGGKTWPQLRRWIPWNKWHRPPVESKPGMICSENAIAPTYAILLHFMLSNYGSPRRLHWGSASDAQRCPAMPVCRFHFWTDRHGIISAIPPAAHGVHLHTPSDAKCLQLKVRANVSTLSSTVGRHIALNIFDSTLIMNIFGTPVFCNTFAWN